MFGICKIVRDAEGKNAVSYSFDGSKLSVGPPKKLNKGKFSNVRYGGSQLFFETPMLHSPLGASSFEDAVKKTLFLSCRGHEEPGDVSVFVEGIERFQEDIIDKSAAAGVMGDGKSRNTLADTMSPFLKPSDTYPPAIRVTLPFDASNVAQFDTFVLDGKKAAPCDFADVDLRGASVKVIFSITGVWVVNKGWGVSAKATQLLVKPSFDYPSAGACCFSDIAVGDNDSERDAASDEDE